MENKKEPLMSVKPIFTDYYLNNFKWYRKLRKCNWYKHKFTRDALELSITFTGTFWALYPEINRYSKIIEIERYSTNNQSTPQ